MKTTGPIYVIRLARPDASTGSAFWASKGTRGVYIWSDRWDAHLYTSKHLARRQWTRLCERLEERAAAGEQLHLDCHPSRMAFLQDPDGTRTTILAIRLGQAVAS